MCKLCNTDRPPIKKPINLLVHEIIKEYTGEYACRVCAKTCFLFLEAEPNKSIDYWVMQRIFYNYYRALGNNSKELNRHKKHLSRKNYSMNNMKTRSILGVCVRENTATNRTVYIVSVKINKKITQTVTCNTFDEALATKIKYMVENNQSYALKNLKNKLKELQNESN
jgi:hypothetical protein